jgi:hypothetical protein
MCATQEAETSDGMKIMVKELRKVGFQLGFDSRNPYSIGDKFSSTTYSCSKHLEVSDAEDEAECLVEERVNE